MCKNRHTLERHDKFSFQERERKNNFDRNDVLTGRVNLAPAKALFLRCFLGGAHTTQFNQGYGSQRGHLFNHFGTEKLCSDDPYGFHKGGGCVCIRVGTCMCVRVCVYVVC